MPDESNPITITAEFQKELRDRIANALAGDGVIDLEWYARMAALDFECTLALGKPADAKVMIQGRATVIAALSGRAAGTVPENVASGDWSTTLASIGSTPTVEELPPEPKPFFAPAPKQPTAPPPPRKSRSKKVKKPPLRATPPPIDWTKYTQGQLPWPAKGITGKGYRYATIVDAVNVLNTHWQSVPAAPTLFSGFPLAVKHALTCLYIFDRPTLKQYLPSHDANLKAYGQQMLNHLRAQGQISL